MAYPGHTIAFVGRRPTEVYVPPRYSPQEWKNSSKLTHESSNEGRKFAEQWMANGFRVIDETEEVRLKGQQEVNWHLHQRLQDLQLWTAELTIKAEGISSTIDDLGIYIKRIENAAQSFPSVIQTNLEILKIREQRQGIDLVNDDPQNQIINELALFHASYDSLEGLMSVCREKLRLLRKFWLEIQREIDDKKSAVEIDSLVSGMNQHSSHVQHQDDSVIKNMSRVHNESEWEERTKTFTTKADKLILDTNRLLAEIESTLRQICENSQSQVCKTNAAIERRLMELRKAKSLLEDEHREISIRIRDMEDLIDKLQKSLKEKDSSIALTETRLCIRNKRPNMELVMDSVQKSLHLELRELKESLEYVQMHLAKSQITMRALLSQQVALEEDINVKLASIALDETQVAPLRKSDPELHCHLTSSFLENNYLCMVTGCSAVLQQRTINQKKYIRQLIKEELLFREHQKL